MATFYEIDAATPFPQQLEEKAGPIVLTNTFLVPAGQMDAAIVTWKESAEIAKTAPGYISTQLHRGIGGSNVLINYAIWDSAHALRDCLGSKEFKAIVNKFPEGTECRAHVFHKLAIENICTA